MEIPEELWRVKELWRSYRALERKEGSVTVPTQRFSTKKLQDSSVVCYFVEVYVEKVQKVSCNGERSEVSHSKS